MKRGDIIRNLDWLTILLFLLLTGLGWLNIFSAVYSDEHQFILDLNQQYGRQFIWICAALVMAFMILSINSRFFEFFSYPIYASVIFLLILVLIIGKEVNGIAVRITDILKKGNKDKDVTVKPGDIIVVPESFF